MNWDLVIGLIIGLSGSIIGLVGTIITNKQNHEHQLTINTQNHAHEIKVGTRKQEFEKELEIQRIALENSFKEFEISRSLSSEVNGESTENKKYPYDMYLLTYMKIVEFMNRKDEKKFDELHWLLAELENIQRQYKGFER